MTTDTDHTPNLDPTIPTIAADWLDAHEWVQHAGDGVNDGCLHTALLRPCSTPGDNIIWHHLMRHRGLDEAWNDEDGRLKADVLDVLRHAADPAPVEMAELFGPQWEAILALVRRASVLTADEAGELAAARDAARDAARAAARDAAWAAARGAARAAARGAARAAAWGAARDAAWGAARASAKDAAWASAKDAAVGLVVRDLIGQGGFTADHYGTLTGPWASVIGPVHPDDVADGLVAS